MDVVTQIKRCMDEYSKMWNVWPDTIYVWPETYRQIATEIGAEGGTDICMFGAKVVRSHEKPIPIMIDSSEKSRFGFSWRG